LSPRIEVPITPLGRPIFFPKKIRMTKLSNGSNKTTVESCNNVSDAIILSVSFNY
jgi:hypothetical protein